MSGRIVGSAINLLCRFPRSVSHVIVSGIAKKAIAKTSDLPSCNDSSLIFLALRLPQVYNYLIIERGNLMAELANNMPTLIIPKDKLKEWGQIWLGNTNPKTGKVKPKKCFDRYQSVNFASFIDAEFGKNLAKMLGDIEVMAPSGNALKPTKPDCVEVGAVRIIGGVRPQNFDAAYRPDGARVVFDSKTLNDIESVGKNWQNMINDLATEATTVHTRFPYAIVAFIVLIPKPCLGPKQQADMIRTLERLGSRKNVLNQVHLAEVISLVVWDPDTGEIDNDVPLSNSILRLEKFSDTLYPQYIARYKGLPPHD
jgi:hypothetical protein